jgi:YggT family protein
MQIVCQLVLAYQIIIIARVLLSWFPLQPGTVMARVNGVLLRVTEPVLGPLRRLLPRMGMLDLSPLVAILLISVLSRVLLPC